MNAIVRNLTKKIVLSIILSAALLNFSPNLHGMPGYNGLIKYDKLIILLAKKSNLKQIEEHLKNEEIQKDLIKADPAIFSKILSIAINGKNEESDVTALLDVFFKTETIKNKFYESENATEPKETTGGKYQWQQVYCFKNLENAAEHGLTKVVKKLLSLDHNLYEKTYERLSSKQLPTLAKELIPLFKEAYDSCKQENEEKYKRHVENDSWF